MPTVSEKLTKLLVALHPEGVDRNRGDVLAAYLAMVALHPEGVDRNGARTKANRGARVALHPEGVDRNPDHPFKVRDDEESPSTRRARVERNS